MFSLTSQFSAKDFLCTGWPLWCQASQVKAWSLAVQTCRHCHCFADKTDSSSEVKTMLQPKARQQINYSFQICTRNSFPILIIYRQFSSVHAQNPLDPSFYNRLLVPPGLPSHTRSHFPVEYALVRCPQFSLSTSSQGQTKTFHILLTPFHLNHIKC